MNDNASQALLPAGLRDILPPDAAFEAEIVHKLMGFFAANGYERVKPPLIEFEEGLLQGSGAAMAGQTFRVMDPVSQRMMGVRADMTLQIARIAATRLSNTPRPLRLSYAGQVLRVKGSQLRPERQFGQAGVELIGSDAPGADAEMVLLAYEALSDLGLDDVTVDLTIPPLVKALVTSLGLGAAEAGALREALNQKDAAVIASFGGETARLFGELLHLVGPAGQVLADLCAMKLPVAAALERDRLAQVIELIRSERPDLKLTVDPVEHRGYEYHSGVSFTLFSRRAIAELGRGGRYIGQKGEPATGFTLFMDTVQAVLQPPETPKRLYLPFGSSREQARKLRAEGWVAIMGLAAEKDVRAEARKLACRHMLLDGKIIASE